MNFVTVLLLFSMLFGERERELQLTLKFLNLIGP